MKVFDSGNGLVKAWIEGVDIEDAAIAQAKATARMPFVFKHVAMMPDAHVGKGSTVGTVIATKNAIIPAAVGVDIGCFVGETKIPLLDGTQRTLAELASESDPFWVYSVDQNLHIVPGRATCRKTRTDAALLRVVVSGGDEIVCTPDHEFMSSDGSFKRAQDLKFNDSLMPLYRKWEMRDGYETITSGKGRSGQTHVLVWEDVNGPVPEGLVIHHKNHIHFDNRPENLETMTASEHSSHHRATGKKFKNSDPAFQELRIAGIERSKEDSSITAQRVAIGIKNITNYMQSRPEHFKSSTEGNGKRGAQYLAAFNISPRKCRDCDHVAANPSALRWHNQREHLDGTTFFNHKVVSVEPLERVADVYCLTVEKHHNFALAAGVFVHNCGMSALRLSLRASDLPDSLAAMRSAIEAAVPHGRTDDDLANDKGSWRTIQPNAINPLFVLGVPELFERHPKAWPRQPASVGKQLGTLGTGNHFIEVCLDEDDHVWLMLHSGSRGLGNRIGTYFIELAKEDMRKWFINLPDQDLAYLPEGTDHFDDYCEAVEFAQRYALLNRRLMMDAVFNAITPFVPAFRAIDAAVECHHNYVAREHHFGTNVLVTRKGAVRAREGDLGIIPGSMGAKSFIVKGKGNAQSFHSCSHGAGRRMSRGAAVKSITLADHAAATAGVECRKDAGVLDESPAAYKDIGAVLDAQRDLIDVVHALKAVLCVKG